MQPGMSRGLAYKRTPQITITGKCGTPEACKESSRGLSERSERLPPDGVPFFPCTPAGVQGQFKQTRRVAFAPRLAILLARLRRARRAAYGLNTYSGAVVFVPLWQQLPIKLGRYGSL